MTEAFKEGRQARFRGFSLKDNPYPHGDLTWLDWYDGWISGDYVAHYED